MACFGDGGYSVFSTNSQYGEKYQYDPSFKGPKSGRIATDVHWLFGYLAFTTLWLVCAVAVSSHVPDPWTPSHQIRVNGGTELEQSFWCYMGPICIATIICLISIYVLRWIATPVVWFSVGLIISAFGIAGGASIGYAFNAQNSLNPNTRDQATAGFVYGILLIIITLVMIGLVYAARKKIAVAIALIKEGSKAVGSSYSTVFFPLIPLIFKMAFIGIFINVLIKIEPFSPGDSGADMRVALHLVNVFGYLWSHWFVDAFEKMVLAHTFSTWYWTFDKNDLPFFAVTTAAVRTTRYHLGTVALGSLLITVGQIICYIIKSLMNNRYMRGINLCCNISEIIERILKFLNKNTFIMVAIHGKPFCESMRDAFNLLMRNIASVYVTNKITTLQFGVINIAICSGMAGLTYALLPNDFPQDFVIYPVLISIVGSYLVASTFFGVHAMAIDTLFLCFLEDIERNDGSEQRPYYMSQSLIKVIHKNSENLLPPPYEHI